VTIGWGVVGNDLPGLRGRRARKETEPRLNRLDKSENVTLSVQRICHPRFPALSMNCRYLPRQGWFGAGLVYRLLCSAVEDVDIAPFLSFVVSAGAGLVVRRLPW